MKKVFVIEWSDTSGLSGRIDQWQISRAIQDYYRSSGILAHELPAVLGDSIAQQIRELFNQGFKRAEIAGRLGIKLSLVQSIMDRRGIGNKSGNEAEKG